MFGRREHPLDMEFKFGEIRISRLRDGTDVILLGSIVYGKRR